MRIKRIKFLLKLSALTSQPKIPILWYDIPDTATLSKFFFKPMIELQQPTKFSTSLGIELLWQSSVLFSPVDKGPQWNRFEQAHQQNKIHPHIS